MINYINELVKKFEITIPENEKQKTELVEAFRKSLETSMKNFIELNSKLPPEKAEEYTRASLRTKTEMYIEMGIDSVKSELLEDDAFIQISDISAKAFGLAREKLEKKQISEEVDTDFLVKRLEELLEKVKPFNKELARTLVSESALDLIFATSEKSDICSLRLGHIIDWYKRKEEREKEIGG